HCSHRHDGTTNGNARRYSVLQPIYWSSKGQAVHCAARENSANYQSAGRAIALHPVTSLGYRDLVSPRAASKRATAIDLNTRIGPNGQAVPANRGGCVIIAGTTKESRPCECCL